jgi:hypothetical protein
LVGVCRVVCVATEVVPMLTKHQRNYYQRRLKGQFKACPTCKTVGHRTVPALSNSTYCRTHRNELSALYMQMRRFENPNYGQSGGRHVR